MPRSFITSAQRLLATLFVAGLAACGGGNVSESSDSSKLAADGALSFVKQIPAVDPATVPVRALAATGSVTVDSVLDWAEYTYPTLFAKGAVSLPFDYLGTRYTIRIYPYASGVRYLGITNSGDIYGLGDFTNNNLQGFGNMLDYAAKVIADECKVYPGRCTGGSAPVGPLNACTAPASEVLATGNRFVATYVMSGTASGQYTVNSVVDGPDTFEGKSAIRSTSIQEGTTTSSGFTFTTISTMKSYQQAQPAGGFVSSLGTDGTSTSSGRTTSLHVVFNPAEVNSEYGLQIGQSITKTLNATTTIAGLPSITSSTSTSYTYEGDETITVQGKSYNTCRYRQDTAAGAATTVTKNWVIRGKGVPARTQSTTTAPGSGAETSTSELVSGTYNGAPL
jgi:hypothetical protein